MRILFNSFHCCTKWCQCRAGQASANWRTDRRMKRRELACSFPNEQTWEFMKLKGPSFKTGSFQRAPAAQIRMRIRQRFRYGGCFRVCVSAGDNTKDNGRPRLVLSSQPSPNTHPELWFANDKWVANTIHELCSCHGDINQKAGPFSRLWTLCLWNWDAWRGLHTEPPEWAQGKAIARYWFCQSLRGLLWVQCNNHTPSGTQTDSAHRQKVKGKPLNS